MEATLFKFLRKIGLNENDIKFICESFPELEEISSEIAIDNAKLVVDYGFPLKDLNWLILINPSFLFADYDELADILDDFGDNVEQILKKNPLLI